MPRRTRSRKTARNRAKGVGGDVDEVRWNAMRPMLVIFFAGIIMKFCMSVEANPTGGTGDPKSILDTGFTLTKPLHAYFVANPLMCDLAALLNSVLVVGILVYVCYVTLWIGDFGLAFRLLGSQFFRAYCGWFTYLPPSPEFLPSQYDVPEIFSSGAISELLQGNFPITIVSENALLSPFVSFYSGHVANVVIVANHMYTNKLRCLGIWMHILNVLQMIRLLATRGHYSIDIIVGWVVAVYASKKASQFGNFYSTASRQDLLRHSPTLSSPMSLFDLIFVDFEGNLRPNEFAEIPKPVLRELAETAGDEARKRLRETNVYLESQLSKFSDQAFASLCAKRDSVKDIVAQLRKRHEEILLGLEKRLKENSTGASSSL